MNVMDKLRQQDAERASKVHFKVGDVVRVHVLIKEGDKERTQMFSGTVIAHRKGSGGGTFTVRRVSHGVGVERVFPTNSPHVAKVEVESSSDVRRAKLYYLRRRTGKRAKLAVSEIGAAEA